MNGQSVAYAHNGNGNGQPVPTPAPKAGPVVYDDLRREELIRLLGLEGEGLVRTYDEFLSGILPEEATWLRELMTTNAQDPRPLDLEVHGLGPPGELRDFYLQGRAVPSATGGPIFLALLTAIPAKLSRPSGDDSKGINLANATCSAKAAKVESMVPGVKAERVRGWSRSTRSSSWAGALLSRPRLVMMPPRQLRRSRTTPAGPSEKLRWRKKYCRQSALSKFWIRFA